ncbi:MAG: glycosyltransferase 87 family protein [Hyphomicrobiaceae bacterium]|nr:glycosyltransferase 87 family protein [Hyphomicrobiaceae bacterium]
MTGSTGPAAAAETRATGWAAIVTAALAVLLVASQWQMARSSPGWTQASFRSMVDVLPVVLLLGAPALLGVMAVPLLTRLPTGRGTVCVMLATGLAMRLVWYGTAVVIDDDYFRYLWDGAILASGQNPYAFAPKSAIDGDGVPTVVETLARNGKDVLAGINFPELTTIYPGTAQLAFTLAHLIAPFDHDGLRAVFLGAELATLALLLVILGNLGRPRVLAALYWLNPLVVWSSHGTGHSEALLAPLVVGACLATWRGREVLAATLLALAIGVKLWPALLVPLLAHTVYARRRSLALPAIVLTGLAGALVLPLALSAAAGARSGLVAYSEHWWTNNGPFSWISYAVYQATGGSPLGQRALRASIAIGVGLIALFVARRPPSGLHGLLASALVVAAATFYLAPAQFPWYALWFLPLAAALACRPLLLASATLAAYYLALPLINQGGGHWHAYGIAFLHALPVWAWLAWDARRTNVGR